MRERSTLGLEHSPWIVGSADAIPAVISKRGRDNSQALVRQVGYLYSLRIFHEEVLRAHAQQLRGHPEARATPPAADQSTCPIRTGLTQQHTAQLLGSPLCISVPLRSAGLHWTPRCAV